MEAGGEVRVTLLMARNQKEIKDGLRQLSPFFIPSGIRDGATHI